ncbi:MAG TPA: aminotransferase class III-fold pyridoxal phosphate-dependent enzyme, partial [Candidatus Deferrimicrobium sp.]|nr:aminotransferase class III-fold pyridoxal phosphate-dependent enzyme [Candidatus Deferrimicrobium sp.]
MNWNSKTFHILSISAPAGQGLRELVEEYIARLEQTGTYEDTCRASNINNTFSKISHRLAAVVTSKEDAIKKLKKYLEKESEEQAELYTTSASTCGNTANGKNGKIAFLFTGQGSIYPGIAKELYKSAPVFKESLDRCDELFAGHIHQSITRLLYQDNSAAGEINQAIFAQPIIFSLEYSLCRLWQSWGIMPAVVMGHSIGEYAAACMAGIFSLEEAVKLVAARGSIMQQTPDDGLMVGVLMDEAKAGNIIATYSDSVSIAAVNGPGNITLSGSRESLEKITRRIKEERLFVEKLDISHPFHSVKMQPFVAKLKEEYRGMTFSRPHIPVISTITGKIAADEMGDPDYWSEHICKTVRFFNAVKTAQNLGVNIFVEIGGTAALCGMAADCLENKDTLFLPSLRKGNHPWRQLCNSLAQLYVNGAALDWEQFHRCGPSAIPIDSIAPPVADRSIEDTEVNINEEKDMELGISHKNKGKRVIAVQSQLKHMLEIIAGMEAENIEENASLFSMGIDSLMVIQLRKKVNEKYNIDITINDFFTTYNSIKKISDFISEQAPEQEPEPQVESHPGVIHKVRQENEPEAARQVCPVTPGKVTVADVIAKQLEFMNRQQQRISEIMEKQLQVLQKPVVSMPGVLDLGPSPAPEPDRKGMIRTNPYVRNFKHEEDDLTPAQKEFIKTFTVDYNAGTQKSKAYAQSNRRVLADWINSLNFRITLKELIYPIVSQRSEGARFWDIDGNEYIDLSIGFGANYFGHRPGFVVEALEKQIKQGYELGTQSNLAGEVADLITRLTGVERVVFSNTGTEAVMAAIRIARSATGRKKIVRFAGSFHGSFDGILAEADEYGTFPISPGTPLSMVADVVVLPYGSTEALEEIERLGTELAAVLVEPVQSRRPGFQPRKFLHRLRDITSRTGAAFIFDDTCMGFRIHQGGSQAYFGI